MLVCSIDNTNSPYASRWLQRLLVLSLFYFAGTNNAQALLVPNIVGDRPETLPKRRSMLSMVQFYSPVGNRFTQSTGKESIESNFNRNVRWQDIIDNDPARSNEISGLLATHGAQPDESAGQFKGTFSGRVTTTVPILGHGITDKVGLFVAVPIVRFQGESRIAFQSSTSSQNMVAAMRDNGLRGAANEFSKALNNGFEEQLNEAGYTYRRSEDRTLIGDVQVVMPIAFSELGEKRKFAVQPTLSIPTGSEAETDDLYRLASGRGTWVPGVRGVYLHQFNRKFAVSSSVAMSYPLPHTSARRVPRSTMAELIKDTDPNVRISGGFSYGAQLDLRYQISRSWGARIGAQHQHILGQTHRGSLYSAERYRLLDEASEERLETIHAAIELNSLRAFLDGDFYFPSQLMIGAAYPISGRSTLADPALLVQVALFF
jgi:hypothetical protein